MELTHLALLAVSLVVILIGAELFTMTAAVCKAQRMVGERPADRTPVELADLFCRQARRRVRQRFDDLFDNDDGATYAVARDALDGRLGWLEEGIVALEEYAADRPGGRDDRPD